MYSIYLMHRDDGVFKFGISKNPNKRKNSLKNVYKQKYTIIFQTEKKYNLAEALFAEAITRLYFFNRFDYSERYKKSLDHFYLSQNKNFGEITKDFIETLEKMEKI